MLGDTSSSSSSHPRRADSIATISRAICTNTATPLSRDQGKGILQNHILPVTDYDRRTRLGREAQGVVPAAVVKGQDPRLFQTYGEFPLESLDQLLDRALEIRLATVTKATKKNGSIGSKNRPMTVVDVGSGCGRLALYLALTRPNWHVHGIELFPTLHQEAICAMNRAIHSGLLIGLDKAVDDSGGNEGKDLQTTSSARSRISLHQGAASKFADLLGHADLVFCYSTAFESNGFSEQTASMLLGREWNELFTTCCGNERCIVITTDKSLDSAYGWTIVDRMDVSNPEVYESTGFIHQFQRI